MKNTKEWQNAPKQKREKVKPILQDNIRNINEKNEDLHLPYVIINIDFKNKKLYRTKKKS